MKFQLVRKNGLLGHAGMLPDGEAPMVILALSNTYLCSDVGDDCVVIYRECTSLNITGCEDAGTFEILKRQDAGELRGES